MLDILEEIFSTIRHNKLRTALTGFAVAWGIFMLIFLLGSGNGLIHAIEKNSSGVLKNSMLAGGNITSKAYKGYNVGRRIELDVKDIENTKREFSANVIDAGGTVTTSSQSISHGENYFMSSLSGVFPNEQQINKIEILYGRFINADDMSQRRKVLVIDNNSAKELMPKHHQSLIGKYVKVGDLAFKVVGIYKTDESMRDNSCYTPFSTIKAIYDRDNTIDNISFTFHGLNTEQENEDFDDQYKAMLNTAHDAAPDDEKAVWTWNRFLQNMQMNNGMSIIRTALWIVGLFTLLSGIVGISNIMLITVKERTHEFGIRKAIGAKPWSILRLIITESVIITTFFGYIGMIAGIAANEYMDATIGDTKTDFGGFSATMFVDPTVGIDVCIEATLVMIIAGTIAGLIPARKAAKIRPIEALNSE